LISYFSLQLQENKFLFVKLPSQWYYYGSPSKWI
jgi:hypothetical protein